MRIALAAVLIAACGPGERPPGTDVDGSVPIVDSPPGQDASRVFAHSGTTLYRLHPTTLAPNPVGVMVGITDDQTLQDLAVNKDDRIVGITKTKLYLLDETTGAATLIRDLSAEATNLNLTSLSYVPGAQPSDPDILVAASGSTGDVYQIDEADGSLTVIGNYGTSGSDQIKSSGDLFGVRGLGIYATVDIGSGTMDRLAKIDPDNDWRATVMPSGTGYDKIFGVGFWAGTIYGFVDDGFEAGTGKMIRIDPTTGVGTVISSGGVRWFGAGVATDAPVLF